MFTKEDYIEYFELIAETELTMVYSIKEVESKISDPHIKNILDSIFKDELNHYKIINELFDAFIRPVIEARKYKREPFLGEVVCRNTRTDEQIKARCLDYSLQGIGIETDKHLNTDDEFELWIVFFEGKKPLHRYAKLKWFKKSTSTLHKGGFEFLAKHER